MLSRPLRQPRPKAFAGWVEATEVPGGYQAVQLRVAEQYVEKLGMLAKENNTMILPANMADISSIIATAMSVIKQTGGPQDEK